MSIAWNWKHDPKRSYGAAIVPAADGYCAAWAEVEPMEVLPSAPQLWRAKVMADKTVVDLQSTGDGARVLASRRFFGTREAASAWCEQSLPTLLAVLT